MYNRICIAIAICITGLGQIDNVVMRWPSQSILLKTYKILNNDYGHYNMLLVRLANYVIS